MPLIESRIQIAPITKPVSTTYFRGSLFSVILFLTYKYDSGKSTISYVVAQEPVQVLVQHLPGKMANWH